MTDNEIIKALECCVTNKCDECAIYKECHSENGKGRVEVVIDLINRQKAEIKELKDILEKVPTNAYDLQVEASEKLENQIKSEAIKEFAEKLKENYCFTDRWGKIITKSTVDNLVKEMTEVEENQRKED